MSDTSSLSESAGHTPGPWYVRHCSGTIAVRGKRGVCVVHWHGPKEGGQHIRAIADAHLIAAAPDLLATGAALLEAAEKHIFGDECKAEREALRAALSKALGQGGE